MPSFTLGASRVSQRPGRGPLSTLSARFLPVVQPQPEPALPILSTSFRRQERLPPPAQEPQPLAKKPLYLAAPLAPPQQEAGPSNHGGSQLAVRFNHSPEVVVYEPLEPVAALMAPLPCIATQYEEARAQMHLELQASPVVEQPGPVTLTRQEESVPPPTETDFNAQFVEPYQAFAAFLARQEEAKWIQDVRNAFKFPVDPVFHFAEPTPQTELPINDAMEVDEVQIQDEQPILEPIQEPAQQVIQEPAHQGVALPVVQPIDAGTHGLVNLLARLSLDQQPDTEMEDADQLVEQPVASPVAQPVVAQLVAQQVAQPVAQPVVPQPAAQPPRKQVVIPVIVQPAPAPAPAPGPASHQAPRAQPPAPAPAPTPAPPAHQPAPAPVPAPRSQPAPRTQPPAPVSSAQPAPRAQVVIPVIAQQAPAPAPAPAPRAAPAPTSQPAAQPAPRAQPALPALPALRAQPAQPSSSQAGPSQAGPSQAGPSQAGPSQAGPSQAGPSQAGPSTPAGRWSGAYTGRRRQPRVVAPVALVSAHAGPSTPAPPQLPLPPAPQIRQLPTTPAPVQPTTPAAPAPARQLQLPAAPAPAPPLRLPAAPAPVPVAQPAATAATSSSGAGLAAAQALLAGVSVEPEDVVIWSDSASEFSDISAEAASLQALMEADLDAEMAAEGGDGGPNPESSAMSADNADGVAGPSSSNGATESSPRAPDAESSGGSAKNEDDILREKGKQLLVDRQLPSSRTPFQVVPDFNFGSVAGPSSFQQPPAPSQASVGIVQRVSAQRPVAATPRNVTDSRAGGMDGVQPSAYTVPLAPTTYPAQRNQPSFVTYTGTQLQRTIMDMLALGANIYLRGTPRDETPLDLIELVGAELASELVEGGRPLNHVQAVNYIEHWLVKAVEREGIKKRVQKEMLAAMRGRLGEYLMGVIR